MKTVGLLGGITYQSTAHYYMHINDRINARLGNYHSAPLLLHSFDFAEIERYQRTADWAGASLLFQKAAKHLKNAGADVLIICANTMHIVADDVIKATGLPLLHIADLTAAEIKKRKAGCKAVGLLGTRYTMQMTFLSDRLRKDHGFEVLVPEPESILVVNDIILNELTKGLVKQESKEVYLAEIERMKARGAEAIILGCTEIPMLVTQEDTDLIVIDTTRVHADAAADWIIDHAQLD